MFVAMAEREKLVRIEMRLARPMMTNARPRPALPTTYPSRKNRMIPRIVRMLGVKTPGKVPRVLFLSGEMVILRDPRSIEYPSSVTDKMGHLGRNLQD